MKPMYLLRLALFTAVVSGILPTVAQSALTKVTRDGELKRVDEASIARPGGKKRRYVLLRQSKGDIRARGEYIGDGASMKVMEGGDASSGTMSLIAIVTAAGKRARFEAFCGAGQCEAFRQKSGPKGRLHFYPDKAVIELEDDQSSSLNFNQFLQSAS